MLDYARRMMEFRGTAAVFTNWRAAIAERTEWIRREVERKAINLMTHIDTIGDGGLFSVTNDRRVRIPVQARVEPRMHSTPPAAGDRYDR